MRKDISAFRHTQYAVYVVVIFAFLCVLIDSAQVCARGVHDLSGVVAEGCVLLLSPDGWVLVPSS